MGGKWMSGCAILKASSENVWRRAQIRIVLISRLPVDVWGAITYATVVRELFEIATLEIVGPCAVPREVSMSAPVAHLFGR